MISQEGNKINEHAIHTVRTPNDDSEKYETSEDLRNDRHSDLTDITNVEGDHEKAHGLPTPEEDLPDGGYGWFIILGAFMVQVTSFGTATSWGVMQDYFEQNKFPNSALELSFVGTLALVFTNLMGPFTQILTSMFGSRIVLMTGTVLVTLALIVAGFSSQIWHLYLTQGIMFGIGASMMYVTIMGVAPQWFTRRRGLALGMVASGSGIGGLVIPFIMTPINSSLGYAWTYRILGFICLACDLVAVVLVKEKFPRKKGRKKLSDIVQLNVLRNFNFILWCVGSVIMLLGYFVPYFFLPSYATFHGLSASQGSALVAVSSAMNFIGRVLAGICADHIGKLNTNIIFTIIGGLSSLLIWTFATNYGSLMAYSVVFGLFCGSYFALLSPVTAFILGMEKFPSGLSVLLLFNVIAVFGPNIASAIENGVSAEPFLSYKLFSGVAYLVGACILTFLKLRLNRNIFAKI